MKKITIAIDGYSSCGKSTMAKQLARTLGYIYVDTGAMYRCVTLYAMEHGMFDEYNNINARELLNAMDDIVITFRLDGTMGLPEACLNGVCVEDKIRGMEVSHRVSIIAALPFVRSAMVEKQQLMGKDKGVVMDGRDIGTTVFPDAELKIFVTADAKVRAQRRYDELKAKGMPADYDDILANVEQRDYIDTHREVSPLRKADDAVVLDNSYMTIEEQDEWLRNKVREEVMMGSYDGEL